VPEGGVHRFAGILAYPNGRRMQDIHYHKEEQTLLDLEQLKSELQADVKSGVFWQEIFLGHPTRILHKAFWDAPNFALGASPYRDAWIPAPRKPKAALDRALTNFRGVAKILKGLPNIELRTIRQMNALLQPLPSYPVQREEWAGLWSRIERNLRGMAHWPILPEGCDLSSILEVTSQRLPTLERVRLSALGSG
jgi:hypothetical protein